MSKLPQVRSKDLLKALLKAGFIKNRQAGSHVYLKHKDGRITTIAIHTGTVPKGTLNAILKQTKLTQEELKKLLK